MSALACSRLRAVTGSEPVDAGRGPDKCHRRSKMTTRMGLGDLPIAESVFQIVRGNFRRAGGLMDAISKGGRPPDPT